MKNKKTILSVVALVLVVAVFVGVYLLTRPEVSQGSKAITVTVVHKDGTEKVFSYRTDEAYLGPVLVKEGLIVMDDAQSGMFSTVDGVKLIWERDKAYWALYIGEEYGMTGVNDTPIADGDSFKLVYTLG